MYSAENKIIDEKKQGQAMVIASTNAAGSKKLYLESYGCAMNFSDSEIVASILLSNGYVTTENSENADLILINTCAIRENAESRVRQRLSELKKLKKNNPFMIVGMLGCMAERLKSKLLEEEKLVDIVAGPDAYRDLPALINKVSEESREGERPRAVNVMLSLEETYADITPVRQNSNGVNAFVSITRGCDNMCSFCVVPFTRGRERSRDPESIVKECRDLFDDGYREVTLLGQNVDSYLWAQGKAKKILSDDEIKAGTNFAQLLKLVAEISPQLRIRFSTSNPQDMTDEVLETIAKHENICKYVHLPVQSGSNSMLERMNRGYSIEKFLNRIDAIRRLIPDCGISTDIITGFCGETEEEHRATLELMKKVKFDFAYMFAYSERPGTTAQKKFTDDVPEIIKQQRLSEVIKLQQKHSAERTAEGLGKVHKVLIEGVSKKSKEKMFGRNSQNTVVVFPRYSMHHGHELKKGEYVDVFVSSCTAATLIGETV